MKQTQSEFNQTLEKIEGYQQRAFQEHEKQRSYSEQLLAALKAAEHNNELLAKQFEQITQLKNERELDHQQQKEQLQQVQHQQMDLQKQLQFTQTQNQTLETLLKQAEVDRRETKLASQEAQHANQETRLILAELKQELAQIKQLSPYTTQSSFKSEQRINDLETRLNNTKDINTTRDKESATNFKQPESADPGFKRFMIWALSP